MTVFKYVCFILVASFATCLSEKLVINSLETKWPHTSFIAETSEFLSTEDDDRFWAYVNAIAKNVKFNRSETHQTEYERAIGYAKAIVNSARFSLLKFSLSLRAFSPRIEVFQQIALEYSTDCAVFVEVNGVVKCSMDEFDDLLKTSTNEPPVLHSIDHVYGSPNKDKTIAILYANLDDMTFVPFHVKLRALADAGRLQYVFRHFNRNQDASTPVGLSGYGVELAIKNTEYKAIDDSQTGPNEADESADADVFGFDFNVLRRNHEHLTDSLNQFRMHLADTEELAPLKQWEVADLSFQAAQRIVDADPEEAIATLADFSQNFPIRARSLVQTKVRKAFRDEVVLNQAHFTRDLDVVEGENALLINGIKVDVDSLDVFQLFNTIEKEENLANAFYQMGYRREYLSLLYNIDLSDDKTFYAVDYRDAFPEYINDLDKDKHYRTWGNSVKLLLQPYFPGMVRPIARNFFTMICIIDPASADGRSILKIAHSLFVHQVPLRIGFVFVVSGDVSNHNGQNDVGVALLNFYNFAKSEKNAAKAIHLLTTLLDAHPDDSLTVENIHKFFKKHFSDQEIGDIFGKDSDYDQGRAAGHAFLRKSGLQNAPKVLLNGVILDKSSLTADKIEDAILIQIMKQTASLQKAVMTGRLTDRDNVQNWIIGQPEVLPRINNRLLSEATAHLPLYNVNPCKSLNDFANLTADERAQCILENVKYLTKSDSETTRWLNVWLVGDFNTLAARDLLRNALKALKKSSNLRIALVQSVVDEEGNEPSVARAIISISRRYPSNVAKQMLHKFLGASESEMAKKYLSRPIADLLVGGALDEIVVHGTSLDALNKDLVGPSADAQAQAYFARSDVGVANGRVAVIVNGLVYGPLDAEEAFEVEDFHLLENIFEKKGAKAIAAKVDKWSVSRESGKSSDVVLRTLSVIGQFATKKARQSVEFGDDSESVVNLISSDTGRPVLAIDAIVDPLSKNAQKLAPILQVLSNVLNCDIRLAMNPKSRLSELPLKRFYRYVIADELLFNNQGRVVTPSAVFRELPNKQLLTLNVIAPDAWMVQPIYAEYDLDNIKMMTVKGNVVAKFQLVHVLVEGHCFDDVTGNPPRGLQFVLGTKSQLIHYDTIVMANLGYFQLKASPGAWILRLRDGKSKDIYEIKSAINAEASNNETIAVLVDSFLGRTVRVRVVKRPGKENENLLADGAAAGGDSPPSMFGGADEEEDGGSLWSSISRWISSSIFSKLTGGETYDKINIFSLASGHLYERFLRIMMLSVIKNTKSPVKFWLLNNYLSPQFRDSIPRMAKHYGFEVELIEYKWPKWLHQQSEKIRIMWGYKILFLDVLFPLDVKKIIFVDADQVVRTDLMELMTLDLGGAPYGYTPFCDSRTSMDGFRFWKQGYWASHLAGRRYHISALYVVDLVKFRQIAAGDRLRGQYQGLSSDPNSLSNLDQDLPNNMIHQVRIKSLPQEWLWCETWCSDESKSTAKTIDLCNNPQTKEPKLDSAMRIIPEWKDYDSEIRQVIGGDEKSAKVETTTSESQEEHEEL